MRSNWEFEVRKQQQTVQMSQMAADVHIPPVEPNQAHMKWSVSINNSIQFNSK